MILWVDWGSSVVAGLSRVVSLSRGCWGWNLQQLHSCTCFGQMLGQGSARTPGGRSLSFFSLRNFLSPHELSLGSLQWGTQTSYRTAQDFQKHKSRKAAAGFLRLRPKMGIASLLSRFIGSSFTKPNGVHVGGDYARLGILGSRVPWDPSLETS